MISYRILDVFTQTRLSGNPLAVVQDAQGLSTAQMQAIAGEFNLSETVFLLPPQDAQNTARLRIFTPQSEMQFAGHPTVGASVALHADGAGEALRLELPIGLITVDARAGYAKFTAEQSLDILAHPPADLVARALGLPGDALAGSPVMASLGAIFTFTPLASREALANASPDIAAMREGNAQFPMGKDFAQAPYWRDPADPSQIHMRMFAPLHGTYEDPATGSACAALARVLARDTGEDVTLRIAQGADMGRPSEIEASTDGARTRIAGHAVVVMQGQIHLP